jgi:hypothetical protein
MTRPSRHPGRDPGSMNTDTSKSAALVFMHPDLRQNDARGALHILNLFNLTAPAPAPARDGSLAHPAQSDIVRATFREGESG